MKRKQTCLGCGLPSQVAYCDRCCPPIERPTPTTMHERIVSEQRPDHIQAGARWIRRKELGAS